MENFCVSIIVPVFNAEKYLDNCINSLLKQTYTNIEIIFTNDGSTDKSLIMLEKYARENQRVFVFTQQNKGPGAARNLGLKNAHGKYILFVDADDTIVPTAVAECVTIMEKGQYDMLVFNAKIIEDSRSVLGLKNSSGEYITLVNEKNEGEKNIRETIKMMQIATVWGKMFKASIIERYQIHFSKHAIGEDARFLLCFLLVLKSSYALNRTLYNYYLHPNEAFHVRHPWVGRIFRFPGIFLDVLKFTLKNRQPFKIFYFFMWLIFFIKSRRNKV